MITKGQFQEGLEEMTRFIMRQSAANMLLVGGQGLSTVILSMEQAARCYADSGDVKMVELYRKFAEMLKVLWDGTNKQSDEYWAESIAGVQKEFSVKKASDLQ